MSRIVTFATCLAALLALAAPALPQAVDPRELSKKPDTPAEYWQALNLEITIGKFEVAAGLLKDLLEANPSDADLVKIEEKDGLANFLMLRNIPSWSENLNIDRQAKKNVEVLIGKVSAALKKHLADPVRINKFIMRLAATEGERSYALRELQRSGPLTIPHFIKTMQTYKDREEFVPIVSALPYLYRDSLPPLLAALDVPDPVIQSAIIDALTRRRDFMYLHRYPETDPTDIAPYLYYASASPRFNATVRKKATDALARLLTIELEKSPPTKGKTSEATDVFTKRLPPARSELTRVAERYYDHKIRFPNPNDVAVWHWDGKEVAVTVVPATKAEEYFGLRFARQALELDPGFPAAQLVYLSLAVEKAVEEAGPHEPLKGEARKLLATVNPELTTAVLEKALDSNRTNTILGTVRALGDGAAKQGARSRYSGQPALVRALNFPNKRVQFAAADALLKVPGTPPALSTTRIMQILRRTVSGEPLPKVLVVDADRDRGMEVGSALAKAGFVPEYALTGKEAQKRLAAASDIDLIMVDHDIVDPDLRRLLPELRADVDNGLLPLIITVPPLAKGKRPPDYTQRLEHLARNFRFVWVMPARINDPDFLKVQIPAYISATMGRPLDILERRAMMSGAIEWLKRMALGERPGFDARLAEDGILKSMRNEDLAALAIEAAGYLPTQKSQRELAVIVLDASFKPEFRAAAAYSLMHNMQVIGPVLYAKQIKGLEALYAGEPEGKLKSNVGQVLGNLLPSTEVTSQRLRNYKPPLAPPPGAAPPPEMKPLEMKEMK